VAEFLRAETEGTVVVQNYEWRTSDSWIADNKIPRHLSYPEFTNVIDIGIDLVSPIATGEHRVTVESIKLYGSMIAPDRWYLLVALLWLGANLIFIAKQLLKLEEQIYKDAIRLSSLADYSRSLEQQSEKYKELSHLDNLTGALSRHGLSHRLNEISNEGKLPERLALIVFDIDHFKQINDKNGHDGGDIVLKEISGYIRQHIRTGDNLVRWGGEEFVLCLSNSSLADAGLVAEKIRTGIAELSISVNSKIIPVTVSSGVSISKTGDTFEQLFHAADQALYRAKNSGRNRVVIAEQNSQ
jgi:diguanylate cyclase (GGDEF)-like protein